MLEHAVPAPAADPPGEPLLEPEVARELKQRRTWIAIAYTVFNLGCYAGLAALGLSFESWPLWGIVWLLQGMILAGFWGVLHDCAHASYLSSRLGNRIAGALWSAPVFVNFTFYKHFHLQHHALTGQEGDTEGERTPISGLGRYLRDLIFWQLGADPIRQGWTILFRGKPPALLRTPVSRRHALIDQWVVVAWIALVVAGLVVAPRLVVVLYLIPCVIHVPVVYLTALSEHYGTDYGTDVLRNTRTTTCGLPFRVFFWNDNFHGEHHAFPSVPSYNLPRVHRLVGHRFLYRERSYTLFHLRLLGGLIFRRHPRDPITPTHT